MHTLLYRSFLRQIAKARSQQRRLDQHDPTYDVKCWNAEEGRPQNLGRILWEDETSARTLRTINAQTVLLNNLEQNNDAADSRLFDYQRPIRADILDFFKQPRIETELASQRQRSELHRWGMVVAPTGAGKTFVITSILQDFGVSRRNYEEQLRQPRVLFVTPYRQLNNQTAEKLRDAGLEVTQYYAHEKDLTGQVVDITDRSLVKAVKENRIDLKKFDILAADEAHYLLAQELSMVMEHPDIPPTVLGFTATRAYDISRDLRNRYPIIHQGDLVDYILKGYLNGIQGFSVEVTVDDRLKIAADVLSATEGRALMDQALVHSVAAAAETLAKTGRKVLVYCQPGDTSWQAVQVAGILRGRDINASAVGAFNTEKVNDERIEAYNNAPRSAVLSTVGMLTHGFDGEDVDAVLFIGVTSKVKATQLLGRGFRRSKKWPVTVAMEFFLADQNDGRYVSMWDILGVERVEQGKVIKAEQAPDVNIHSRPGDDDSAEPVPRNEMKTLLPEPKNTLTLDDFPAELRRMCEAAEHKTIAELVVAAEVTQEVPGDYVELDYLAATAGVTLLTMRRQLEGKFICLGRWEEREMTRRFIRYYPPEAIAHAEEHRAPEPLRATDVTETVLMQQYAIGRTFLETLARRRGYEPTVRVRAEQKGRDRVRCYAGEAALAIGQEIALIPEGSDSDVTVAGIAEQLGCAPNFVYRWLEEEDIASTLRRYQVQSKISYRYGLDASVLERVRQAYDEIPPLAPTEMTFNDAAAQSGVSRPSFKKLLTAHELAVAELRRQKGKAAAKPVWAFAEGDGRLVVDRLKRDELPPYLVATSYIAEVINCNRNSIGQILTRGGYRGVPLKLSGAAPASCYTWEAVRYLEQKFGRKPGVQRIDYPEPPTPPIFAGTADRPFGQNDELDTEEIAYRLGATPQTVAEHIVITQRSLRGLLPPEKKPNGQSRITDHYKARFLRILQVSICGASAEELAASVDIHPEAVAAFLRGHPASADCKYGLEAWKCVQLAFQRAPAEYVALQVLPKVGHKTLQQTVAFITSHGGQVRAFDDFNGTKQPYVTGLSRLLVEQQANRYRAESPPPKWYTRRRIIDEAHCDPAEFDQWLSRAAVPEREIGWFQYQEEEEWWVLPHFHAKRATQFLIALKNKRTQAS